MGINQEELAICRRRGHVGRISDHGWNKCSFCGMWMREVRHIEEREDEPPEDEIDPLSPESLRSLEFLDSEK